MSSSPLEFELQPGVGAGSILLGMSRDAARSLLSSLGLSLAHTRGTHDSYGDAIKIEYSRDDLSQFIEFSCSSAVRVRYRGVEVFSVAARELHDLIAREESGPRRLFNRHGAIFPEQMITLWDADTQYDCRTLESKEVWGAVGIGNGEYLKAVRAIRGDV